MSSREPGGYASYDPRGYYHYHAYRGGPFITFDRYINLLLPSLEGYLGQGRIVQPYGAIAQQYGPGIPTTGHQWWREAHIIETPTTDIARKGGLQYMIDMQVMDKDGNITRKRLFTRIGFGYDIEREGAIVDDYLKRGTGTPPVPVDDWEELEEVDRVVVELDWHATPGILGY